MRLLFVAPNLETGGAERQWATLIPLLFDRGFDAEVLTLDGRGVFFDELATSVPVRCAGLQSRWSLRGLRRTLDSVERAPDVVVTRGVSAQVFGALLARSTGAAHLTTEHRPVDADGRMLPYGSSQRALIRFFSTRADRTIAVAGAQVPAIARLGFPLDRIEVIANGVSAGAVVPSRARDEMRDELGCADGEFVALLGAGLRPEKSVETFVAAVARAHAENPSVRGLIAGDGQLRSRIEALCATTAGAVRLLGRRTDVPDLLHAADVACLTSTREAMPMILLEAMAAARPVVASAVGGISELVTPGTGVLAPAGDTDAFAHALLALACDRDRAWALGLAGQVRQRERFGADAMADSYADLLRVLAEARSGVAPELATAVGA